MIVWNPLTGTPLYECPNPAQGSSIFNVQWCNQVPSLLSSCSYDGRISIQSLNSIGPQAPRWLRRPSSCSFGFGGKLVYFGPEVDPTLKPQTESTASTSSSPATSLASTAPAPQKQNSFKVYIQQVVTEPKLVELSSRFQDAMKKQDYVNFATQKLSESQSDDEKNTWTFMNILLQDKVKQRSLLLKELGFEALNNTSTPDEQQQPQQQQTQQQQQQQHARQSRQPKQTQQRHQTTGQPSQQPTTTLENVFRQAPVLSSAEGTTSPLEALRNLPQLHEYQRLVQQNPQLIEPLLQQLAQTHPHIIQYINQHQEEFMSLLTEGGGGDDGEDEDEEEGDEEDLQVTKEEKEAIERLEGLGFGRATVIQAFFACDKDENLTANYLLEHGEDAMVPEEDLHFGGDYFMEDEDNDNDDDDDDDDGDDDYLQ